MNSNLAFYIKRLIANKKYLVLFLFFTAFCMFFAARYSIFCGIFGGDVVNVTNWRPSSYAIRAQVITDHQAFCSLISKGEQKGALFLHENLSEKGRLSAGKIAVGNYTQFDINVFIHELNISVIDRPLTWPIEYDIHESLPLREANATRLAKLFPDYINVNYREKISFASAPSKFKQIARMYFSCSTVPARYSPVTHTYVSAILYFLNKSPERIPLVIAFAAVQYAILFVLFFLLADFFLKNHSWALICTFMFSSAMSTITASYMLFSLPYLLVPIVMCGAFCFYFRYRESGHIFWLSGFILFSIVGPWIREFPSAIPFVVLAHELVSWKGKRSVHICITSLLLIIHVLVPTVIPWLLRINTGNIYSLFDMGSKAKQQFGFNWYAAGFTFVQLPPLFWGLVITAISIGLFSKKKLAPVQFHFPFMEKPIIPASVFSEQILNIICRYILTPLMLYTVFTFAYSFFILNQDLGSLTVLKGYWLVPFFLVVTLYSSVFGWFLPIYFLAVFFPFFTLRLWEVHLCFVLPPLFIMLFMWIKNLYHSLFEGKYYRFKLKLRYIFFGILVLTILDQSLNLVAAFSTQKKLVDTNREMAVYLRKNIPLHSAVLCNFFNFEDIFLYSDYHFEPYETVQNCPMGPLKVIYENEDFKKYYESNHQFREIYFLAAEMEYFEWTANYSPHKFVRNPPIEIKKICSFPLQNNYLYLDPFKYLTPRMFVSFPGYMDWFIDYYYDNSSIPFIRTVQNNYVLYKTQGEWIGFKEPAAALPPPIFISPILVSSYKDYNFVRYGEILYGVPQMLGPLDLQKAKDRSTPGILTAETLDELKRKVDDVILSTSEPSILSPPQPVLVSSYKEYNFVRYGDILYGVPQSLGALDLQKEKDCSTPGILTAENLDELKKKVEDVIFSTSEPFIPSPPLPILVSDYKDYNFVRYGEIFYGVPQSFGPLDLQNESDRTKPGILTAESIHKLKRTVDDVIMLTSGSVVLPSLQPVLLGNIDHYNIVYYNGDYFGVPRSLGALDLSKESDRGKKEICTAKTKEELQRLIIKRIIREKVQANGKK